jgi:acyl carrier protein
MKQKVEVILSSIRPDFDFKSSVNFIEDGGLDSFDVINLVNELDREFQISISGVDILPENFSTLASILKLIDKNLAH